MKKKLGIQVTILVSFLLVLIVACGSIIFYNYSHTSGAFLEEVEEDIQRATETIASATVEYLLPAKITTQFIGWVASKRTSVIDRSEDIAIQSMKMLDLYPQIAGFYNGDKHGNLLAIKRVPPGSSYPYESDRKLPVSAKYEIRIINRTSGVISEFHQYKDNNGRTVATVERPRSTEYFDPRFRPWYRGADETKLPYWSDPYIFLLSQQVGVTAATPILNGDKEVQLVISADITMTEISRLMERHTIGKSGITFVLNQRGEIVGYPNLSKVVQGKRTTLATYKDTKNPVLIKAYSTFRRTQNMSFEINHDGVEYIVRMKRFGEKFNKKWIIGFLAPKSDFTGDVDETTRLMMIFSLLIVFLSAALIYVISKNIARPIEQAAKDMKSIGQFQIADHQPISSHFYEIQLMNEALDSMKQSLKDFSRFVPKAVASKLIESGSGAQIGGRKHNISLMFTDIAGFTSISEKMSSEKLIQHLSNYLNELTIIIQENQGTIDKYIGDAIMTFWGAPISTDDHAAQACRTALLCKDRLQELNKTWELDGKPAMHTRFGIHTGDAIVGNVGSEDRLNYSAFGDGVNLAARLESSNKFYGTTIMISHETYKKIRHKFICRPLDVVAVVGKTEGIKIYELLVESSSDPETNLDQEEAQTFADMTEEAFALYLAREWSKAIKKYQELKKAYPNDHVADIFIDRCKEFKASPPAEDWNGVYALKSK